MPKKKKEYAHIKQGGVTLQHICRNREKGDTIGAFGVLEMMITSLKHGGTVMILAVESSGGGYSGGCCRCRRGGSLEMFI